MSHSADTYKADSIWTIIVNCVKIIIYNGSILRVFCAGVVYYADILGGIEMKFLRNVFRVRKEKESQTYCMCSFQLLKKHTKEVSIDGYRQFEVEDVYIYCPYCRTRKCVTALEWELVQQQQKIDKEHMGKYDVVPLERSGLSGGVV